MGLQQIDLKKIDDEDDNLKKFDSQYLELPWNFNLQPPSLCKILPWLSIHLEENQKRQAHKSHQTRLRCNEQCI